MLNIFLNLVISNTLNIIKVKDVAITIKLGNN